MTNAAATRSPYAVLLVCGLPFLMMTLDGTVVNVALPTISKDLGASMQSLQWIVSAYILVIASFVLMAGMLADRFGRRTILAIGVGVFTVGSFACGLAPDEGWLITFRAFQAIGAAMISPSALAIVTNTFTQPAARAKALGWWSVIASAGLAVGPLLGGLLVQSLGWRSVFWVNIIPGVLAVIALLIWAPQSRADKVKPFDPLGQTLLVLVLGSVVFVIIELSTLGWSSPFIIGGCAIGVVALVVMIVVERGKAEALIPFELFRSRAFTTSILTLVFGVLGLGAVAFTLSLFLQNYRGLSPAEAGLFTLPMAVGSMIAAPLVGRFVAAGRAHAVLIFSAVLIIIAGATFWLTAAAVVWLVLIPFLLMGIGFGALNDPVNVSAISELPDEKAGLAASLIAMGRQVGQVLGVAIAGALLAVGLGADMKTHFSEAATSVWILLIIVGAMILLINVLPARKRSVPPPHAVPTLRHPPATRRVTGRKENVLSVETRAWRPSLWLRSLASVAPARWPAGRSIRTALAVAGPLVVASLLGQTAIGMWISMGSLLLAMGERSDTYPARFRRILIGAPIAAASYFLGWLSEAPPVVTILVMTIVAFAGGVLSGYSGPLSIATMQGMLTAAIAIGVPAAKPYWPAAVLFLAGAALYAALLGIEALFNRRRPQRDALVAVLKALSDLARARSEGHDDVEAGRARTVSMIDAYAQMEIALRGRAQGPTREYERSAVITRAADQLLARLLAHDADRALCAATASRLDTVASALATGKRPPPATSAQGTLVRLAMLEEAIWDEAPASGVTPPAVRARLSAPSPELLMTALRLALCTALAYLAYYLVPLAHPYWIALTVALVMKPDLGSVFARGVLRSVGTVGGALIAIAVGSLIHEPLLLAAAIAILALLLPWAAARSYALQALFLTPLIMMLLTMVTASESVFELTVARILTTVIGSVIVIVFGYLVWPSARHARIATPFEASLAALTAYAGDVAAGKAAAIVTADRRRAYRALSDTKVSVQRTLAEPPPAGREAWAWIPVVTAAERVADRITDASASRPPQDVSADVPALTAIAAELETFTRGAGGGEQAVRVPAPPAHGGDSADAVVRELADEVANLRPMLERRHPDRAVHHGAAAPHQ